MKIYKIVGMHLIDKFDISVVEFSDVKETANSYMFDGRRVKKNTIHKIEANVHSPRNIIGSVYVLEKEQIENYARDLHKKLLEKLHKSLQEIQFAVYQVDNWNGELKLRIVE